MLKNVLIIDDEKIIRQGIRLSVPWEELGFKVIGEAETAMEALEKLDTCDIDLVLVDVQMPGMDGIEFIQEMRKNYPHLKALIISGHSNFEYIASALKLRPISRMASILPAIFLCSLLTLISCSSLSICALIFFRVSKSFRILIGFSR